MNVVKMIIGIWYMAHISIVLLLFIPTILEAIDDRDGDPDKKRDVYVRGAMMLAAAIINAVVYYYSTDANFLWRLAVALYLTFAIFFAAFDYLMARIYNKPLTYLGTTSDWDGFIRSVPWGYMLAIRGVIFLSAIILYFI